jgi:hypothetical protein
LYHICLVQCEAIRQIRTGVFVPYAFDRQSRSDTAGK